MMKNKKYQTAGALLAALSVEQHFAEKVHAYTLP